MKNAKELVKKAEEAAAKAESWADLSNFLFDQQVGLVARAFPTRKEREQFVKTPEYKRIRQILSNAMDAHGLVEGAEPKAKSGRFVVRVPKSLHAALEQEAEIEGVSLNQLVVAKLSAQLRSVMSASRP